MPDYKSLFAVVMICATLINIQTHTDRQHDEQLISTAQPAELKMLKSTATTTRLECSSLTEIQLDY